MNRHEHATTDCLLYYGFCASDLLTYFTYVLSGLHYPVPDTSGDGVLFWIDFFVTAARPAYAGTEGCYRLRMFFFFFLLNESP